MKNLFLVIVNIVITLKYVKGKITFELKVIFSLTDVNNLTILLLIKRKVSLNDNKK